MLESCPVMQIHLITHNIKQQTGEVSGEGKHHPNIYPDNTHCFLNFLFFRSVRSVPPSILKACLLFMFMHCFAFSSPRALLLWNLFAKERRMWLQGKPRRVGNSLNVLDKCTVCKGANLISMIWNFKGITCCNCLTRESINHCAVRSSCNFFPNAGIYFLTIFPFFWFNLARSFKRLIAAIFKNNKLLSHMFQH